MQRSKIDIRCPPQETEPLTGAQSLLIGLVCGIPHVCLLGSGITVGLIPTWLLCDCQPFELIVLCWSRKSLTLSVISLPESHMHSDIQSREGHFQERRTQASLTQLLMENPKPVSARQQHTYYMQGGQLSCVTSTSSGFDHRIQREKDVIITPKKKTQIIPQTQTLKLTNNINPCIHTSVPKPGVRQTRSVYSLR